jgi:hypothetical protein
VRGASNTGVKLTSGRWLETARLQLTLSAGRPEMGMREEQKRSTKSGVSEVLGFALALVLLPLLLPFVAVSRTARWVKGHFLAWRFRREWGRKGRVAVVVYSDSPNWKNHIEGQVLPRVAARVVTVNWSRRFDWRHHKPVEVRVFQHWGGCREFNPMAIIVPRRGKVLTVRLWAAFRELKQGKPERLQELERVLFEAIEAA